MTVLTEQGRTDASFEFQKEESRERSPINGTKADCKILMDSLDDYLDTNLAAMNQAIPQPQRGMFTPKQKARALKRIINKRFLQE